MVIQWRDSDSGGTRAETEAYNVVFVDTSLDTHLAVQVSKSDTVSDFKKEMVLAHASCFPEHGDITIHCLKIKCGSNFYHLPDIMIVYHAFGGDNRVWYLSAYCSLNKNLHSEITAGFDEVDKFKNETTGFKSNVQSIENAITESRVKKKQCKIMVDAAKEDTISKEIPAYMSVESENEHLEDITIKESRVSTGLIETNGEDAKSNGNEKNRKKARKTTAKIQDSSILQHETRKDESIEPNTYTCVSGKIEEGSTVALNQNDEVGLLYKTSECIDPDLMLKPTSISPNLLEANITMEPKVSSDSRKKNRRKKLADTNMEKSGMEKTNMSDSGVLLGSSVDLIREETEIPKNLLDANAKFQYDNGSDDADFAASQTAQNFGNVASVKEAMKKNQSSGNFDTEEQQILEFNKRERRSKCKKDKDEKKSQLTASVVQGNLPITDQQVCSDKEMGKKDLNSGNFDAEEKKTLEFNRRERRSNTKEGKDKIKKSPISDQSVKEMGKKDQSSGNFDAEEKQALEFIQRERRSKRKEDKDKIKKSSLTASDFQANLSISDQNVDDEVYSEALTTLRKPELWRDSPSSIISYRSEENIGELTGKTTNSNDLGITFEHKVDSGIDIINATKSNDEMKNGKKSAKRKRLFTESAGIFQNKSPDETMMMVIETGEKQGLVFQDNSGEDFAKNDHGIVDSNASTYCSPDRSSVLDKENELREYSTKNGSSDVKGRYDVGKDIAKLNISPPSKDMITHMVLRSSKKSQLQLSQSEVEQDESQMIEFVPDSLASQ